MSDYSNIPLGLKITTQIPLNVKEYVQNEAALVDLGLNDNLAFTYVQGSKFYCIEEGTRYEWREVVGVESGLRTNDYTYPSGISAFGITYSNKVYNFFSEQSNSQINSDWNSTSGLSEILNKPTIITPPFQAINEGSGIGYIVRGRNATFYGPIGDTAFDMSFSDAVSSVYGATGVGAVAFGDYIQSSGYGSISFGSDVDNSAIGGFVSAYNSINRGYQNSLFGIGHDVTNMNCTVIGQASNIINFQIADFNVSSTKPLFVIGNGTLENDDPTYTVLTRSDAFIVKLNGVATLPSITNNLISAESTGKVIVTKEYLEYKSNLQKTITASYLITSADNNYTIIIDNGADPINITIPSGLLTNIFVGFIQKGTGDVTFVPSGTTIQNPIGLKSKGQYYNTSIDQEGASNVFYLLGNTKL